MACKLCGAAGPEWCNGCRRQHGGSVVVRLPTSHRSAPRAATASKRAAKPATPRVRVQLTKAQFLARMEAGKRKAARKRARVGK